MNLKNINIIIFIIYALLSSLFLLNTTGGGDIGAGFSFIFFSSVHLVTLIIILLVQTYKKKLHREIFIFTCFLFLILWILCFYLFIIYPKQFE